MDTSDIERGILHQILAILNSNNDNRTTDVSRPAIRHTLRHVYPLFILLNGFVILFGTCGNIAMIVIIIKNKLYRNPTFFFLGNLAFSDLLKSMVVLPVSLTNLLIEPWLFGSFLCYFLPMMQFFPIHASMLTFLMIAVDRYRFIVHPMQTRMSAGLCTIAIWMVAVCVVLPFAFYIEYYDLSDLGHEAIKGVGICIINMGKKIEEYIRAIFVSLYCLPLAITAFMYVKVSGEFKVRNPNSIAIQFTTEGDDHVQSVSETSCQSRITWSTVDNDHRLEPEGASGGEVTRVKQYYSAHAHTSIDYPDDLDVDKEKRTQKYLISMVVLFAMCWCPINILVVVSHFVIESPDKTGHFDITYLTFTFFGFLSTCINPVLFASWRMPSSTKDRLKGYFRFSNRRRSCTSPSSATSTQTTSTELYASQKEGPTSPLTAK